MIIHSSPFSIPIKPASLFQTVCFPTRYTARILRSARSQSRPFRAKMPRHSKKGPSAPKKPPLTHFLCIPLVNATSKSQLEDSLRSFKDATTAQVSEPIEEDPISEPITIESNPTSQQYFPVIAEKAIRPVGTLHLTLGVMSLDAPALASAISFLAETNVVSLLDPSSATGDTTCHSTVVPDDSVEVTSSRLLPSLSRPISPPPLSSYIAKDLPLKVSLKSLISMHPPHKTSILYTAPEDPSQRLQPFCEALRKRFQEGGFLVEDTRALRLHATLVNTIYAKGRKKRGKAKPKTAGKGTDNGQVEALERPSHPPGGGDENTLSIMNQATTPASGADANINEKPDHQQEDDRSQGHGPDAKAPLRIDAREILEKYKDYVWAENVQLDRIAICEMGAKKILNDKGEVIREEYKEVATLKLPDV